MLRGFLILGTLAQFYNFKTTIFLNKMKTFTKKIFTKIILVFSILAIKENVFAQSVMITPTNANHSDSIIVKKNLVIGETTSPGERLHVLGNTLIDGGKLIFRNTGKSIFIGDFAGNNDNFDDRINVYIGESAGSSTIDGFSNVYIGSNAGGQNVHGNSNTAIGEAALYSSLTSFNVAIGKFALNSNVNGANNTAIGNYAGYGSTGNNNFFLGTATGESATGNFNVFLGNEVGSFSNVSNKLFIDNSNTDKPLIEGDFLDKTLKINGKFNTTDNIGVKTNAPNSTLEINGSMALKVKSGLESGVNDPDESAGIWIYTLATGNITLPSAATCSNRTYTIVNKTASSITISDFKDMQNATETTIASATSILIVSDGTNWQRIK